jgi:two-component system, OmpR family, response regulator RegX3
VTGNNVTRNDVSESPSEYRILLVEDEESFIEALTVGLSREGFEVHVARDGDEALEAFRRVNPDLILLDLMLPKMSGVDVCREIRRSSSVPIVMVTARGSEIDTVVALEVGADDYVTKPYRLRELVARMRAVLRRHAATTPIAEPSPSSSGGAEADLSGDVFRSGDIIVDADRHEVSVRGAIVPLPLKEFDLLMLLVANAGRALSRDVIIDRVWGSDYYGDTKTLDVHIKRLRSKVETDPSNPTRIQTIRGFGYKFASA